VSDVALDLSRGDLVEIQPPEVVDGVLLDRAGVVVERAGADALTRPAPVALEPQRRIGGEANPSSRPALVAVLRLEVARLDQRRS
jgi:hypothetical protein